MVFYALTPTKLSTIRVLTIPRGPDRQPSSTVQCRCQFLSHPGVVLVLVSLVLAGLVPSSACSECEHLVRLLRPEKRATPCAVGVRCVALSVRFHARRSGKRSLPLPPGSNGDGALVFILFVPVGFWFPGIFGGAEAVPRQPQAWSL